MQTTGSRGRRGWLRAATVICLILPVLAGGTAAWANTVPVSYVKECVPDFSQYLGGSLWSENWCAPTAASNSLFWMGWKYNLPKLAQMEDAFGQWVPYQDSREMIEEVARDMGFTEDLNGEWVDQTNGGVDREHFLSGMKKYMAERYPVLVQKTMEVPTLDWLKSELYACEDVEVAVGYYYLDANGFYQRDGGHMMTFVGWDANRIAVHDPARNASTTPVQKDYPGTGFDHSAYDDYYGYSVGAFTLNGKPAIRLTDYPGGIVIVECAFSESLPEPLTMVGLFLSVSGVLAYLRKRARA